MRLPAPRVVPLRVSAFVLAAVLVSVGAIATMQTPPGFTLYAPDGRHPLAVRTISGTDFVSLDQLASLFGLKIAEDTLVGGLTIQGGGQTILLIPGQSFASVGPGKVVALPAAVQRDRGSWQVPLDFIRLALGPALNQRVEIRRPTRTILVGDVRLPQITPRLERVPPNARLTLELQSPAPHRVTRDGNRLLVRFDAVALDVAPMQGTASEFATAVRTDGTTVVVELGPATANYRVDDTDPTEVAIDFMAPGAPPPVAAAPVPTPAPRADVPEPRVLERSSPGLDTIVIDPGHGGTDDGVRGPGGTKEKDYVLVLARRLKATIESRIGLRVVLTRDGDETVSLDRRASVANNDKADLFISLHLNASMRPRAKGAQVLALNPIEYQSRTGTTEVSEPPVPLVGGGTRAIDLVPWDLAQLPFADRSMTVANLLTRQLVAQKVPLFTPEPMLLPLRPLVAANMPAVMLEMGFLSNAEEEKGLARADRSAAIVDAVVATIEELRRGVPPPLPAAGGRP